MTGTTGTAVSAATFRGADVDGLRTNATGMTKAAQVCDDVKAACQAIAAAAFFLGPAGSAFVQYLETEVIPWLTKISSALQALSKVLTTHADAQDDVSSPTSLPSYTNPDATTPTPALATTTPATTVDPTTTDPTITGNPTGPGTTVAGATSGDAQPSAVGLLQIPVAISPDGRVTPLITTDTAPGLAPMDTTSSSPDLTTSTTPTSATSPALTHTTSPDITTTPSRIGDVPTHAHGQDASGSGGGGSSGGGSGTGGGYPSTGYSTDTPSLTGLAPVDPSAHAASHGAAQQPQTLTAQRIGASHDGLFAGLGQATGIGAGGAALARAVVVEARRAALTPSIASLPADARSDEFPQLQIFDRALG